MPRRSLAAQAAVGGPVTKRVFFDIELGGKPAGRIVIGLYGTAAASSCMLPALSIVACSVLPCI